VLPFHAPGLAPVEEQGGDWLHVRPDGSALSSRRFARAFGFYEGIAAVTLHDGRWAHLSAASGGGDAYDARAAPGPWAWAGNFQSGRCAVRAALDGRYYHITAEGRALPGGPHAYAGDFREGAAVVRRPDGLCVHIGLDGGALHAPSAVAGRGLLELDVFHKGLARARDARGWFWVDRLGADAAGGRRYAAVEPFYNGQALVTGLDGERRVVTEEGSAVVELPQSPRELDARVQELVTASWWAPAAVRLGLDAGLPAAASRGDLHMGGGALLETDDSPAGVHAAHTRRVAEAWMDIGLLRADGGSPHAWLDQQGTP
jgi:hypothetical protein